MIPSMFTVHDLKTERLKLQGELTELEMKRRRLALLNDLIKTYEITPSGSPNGDSEKGAPGAGPYSGKGITEGIQAFLALDKERYFTPTQIVKALMDGGIKVTSENFANMVHTTCTRNSGKWLEESTVLGKRAFRLKKTQAPVE